MEMVLDLEFPMEIMLQELLLVQPPKAPTEFNFLIGQIISPVLLAKVLILLSIVILIIFIHSNSKLATAIWEELKIYALVMEHLDQLVAQ